MQSRQANASTMPGTLIRPRAMGPGTVSHRGGIGPGSRTETLSIRGKHWLAFAGVYLFTLLLYARPNDLFPGLGSFPLVKIVAIGALMAYIASKAASGERLSVWTKEMTMLLVIVALGLILAPVAASPSDSLNTLSDPFLKTVIIFILMVNLIDTRQRIFSMWKLVVICGSVLGLGAIKSYARGEFTARGVRIEGLVGGMFGNPNDLATALVVLLPFAVFLALSRKGVARLFYLGCAAIMTIAALVTFSRGGFLGLIALGGVLLWKLGRGRRFRTLLASALICGILFVVTPGGYGSRISTIFNIEEDETGSAQERRELMELAASMAIRRPIVGVGMGNFHIYSIHEKQAHNSYLEIAAELGVMGLIAYLIVILAPLRSLRRIERKTKAMESESDTEMYRLSVCIQASLIAYMVCSFFASIQYLWYLYYAAAYAVALRQIYKAEELENATSPGEILKAPAYSKQTRGALWQPVWDRIGRSVVRVRNG